MKTCLLIIGFSLIAMIGHCQNSFVSLSIGPSFPMGDFASTDLNSEDAGYAKVGFNIDIAGGSKFWGPAGLMAMFKYNTNPYNDDEASEQLNQILPGLNGTVESTPWSNAAFLGGGFVQLPLGSSGKAFFDIRGLLGYSLNSFPNVEYNVPGVGNLEVKADSKGAFAFLIGAGFHFILSEKVWLELTADYFSSSPEFKTKTYDTGVLLITDKYQYNMSTLALNLGIGIML